jgi:hypothetical protein
VKFSFFIAFVLVLFVFMLIALCFVPLCFCSTCELYMRVGVSVFSLILVRSVTAWALFFHQCERKSFTLLISVYEKILDNKGKTVKLTNPLSYGFLLLYFGSVL